MVRQSIRNLVEIALSAAVIIQAVDKTAYLPKCGNDVERTFASSHGLIAYPDGMALKRGGGE